MSKNKYIEFQVEGRRDVEKTLRSKIKLKQLSKSTWNLCTHFYRFETRMDT